MKSYYHYYKSHFYSAKQRGIPFLLTFDEWLNIWESSGHLSERGKYVMSRIGDKGPYAVGNVFIQTNGQNARDGAHGVALWTDEELCAAIDLFLNGSHIEDISKKIGRSAHAIRIKLYRKIPNEFKVRRTAQTL